MSLLHHAVFVPVYAWLFLCNAGQEPYKVLLDVN